MLQQGARKAKSRGRHQLCFGTQVSQVSQACRTIGTLIYAPLVRADENKEASLDPPLLGELVFGVDHDRANVSNQPRKISLDEWLTSGRGGCC